MTTENPFIPAATIILMRDAPGLEALMIERHADTPFAGGALVFPGGRIEKSDADPAWAGCCDGFDAAPAEERGPGIAAIREAFEETGILLARGADGAFVDDACAGALHRYRRAVEDDDALFRRLIMDQELTLALDALRLFARWRPPREATHRRYDTWFFAAKAPPGQQAREDGNEATEAVWTSPAAALRAKAAGKRKMIFPTTRNVELLGVSDSADAALDFAARRTIRIIEPNRETKDGRPILTIPDDMGYPVTEESLETAFRD